MMQKENLGLPFSAKDLSLRDLSVRISQVLYRLGKNISSDNLYDLLREIEKHLPEKAKLSLGHLAKNVRGHPHFLYPVKSQVVFFRLLIRKYTETVTKREKVKTLQEFYDNLKPFISNQSLRDRFSEDTHSQA